MHTAEPQGWRLRIRSPEGRILGCGFLISDDLALTCAHVVTGHDRFLVRPAVPQETEFEGYVRVAKGGDRAPRGADVAVVEVPGLQGHVRPAPLGPLEPVMPGTILRAYGYPNKFGKAGVWTEVTARGVDMSGECVQTDPHGPGGIPIQSKFSGGPVMNVATGRVVGMSKAADTNEDRGIAWILPLTTIATYWPQLQAYVPAALDVDADYRQGQADLAHGDYRAAVRAFAAAAVRLPQAPVYYRLALARLGRRSPRALLTEQLRTIDALLRRALRTDPAYAPAAMLLAVVREDAYEPMGVPDDSPYIADLRARALHCTRHELIEIRAHCPAVGGSPTWHLATRKDRTS